MPMPCVSHEKLNIHIGQVLGLVLKNPSVFFSEADVQALFYERLRRIETLNMLFDTGCTLGLNQYGEESDKRYQTYAIHREYGLNNEKSYRIDLAIFNPDHLQWIVDPLNLKDKNGAYLTPDYIFEFGTDKSAMSQGALEDHLKNDIEKLRYANKMGYLIHLQRNYLKGIENQANIDKHDNYLQALNGLDLTGISNVKILYFKVDVGGPKRLLMRSGKIKMYTGSKMKAIAQDRVEEEIRARL